MANKLSILQRSKRVEMEVARYFWPDHDEDEQGSVRDWKELWDCSGLGFDGQLIICEVKSWKWKPGPRGIWTLLENAYGQLLAATSKAWTTINTRADSEGTHWYQQLHVVIYKPTGSQVENAICYFDFHGQMVAMPAHQFKRVFINGETDVR